jgi:hypothetical protein
MYVPARVRCLSKLLHSRGSILWVSLVGFLADFFVAQAILNLFGKSAVPAKSSFLSHNRLNYLYISNINHPTFLFHIAFSRAE